MAAIVARAGLESATALQLNNLGVAALRFTFTACCLLLRILAQSGEALGAESAQGSRENTTSAERSSTELLEEDGNINEVGGAAVVLPAQVPRGNLPLPDMEQVQDLNAPLRLAEIDIFLKAYIQQVRRDWKDRGESFPCILR
jgi:hypothetical protein